MNAYLFYTVAWGGQLKSSQLCLLIKVWHRVTDQAMKFFISFCKTRAKKFPVGDVRGRLSLLRLCYGAKNKQLKVMKN